MTRRMGSPCGGSRGSDDYDASGGGGGGGGRASTTGRPKGSDTAIMAEKQHERGRGDSGGEAA
jgi:hypothetical protein